MKLINIDTIFLTVFSGKLISRNFQKNILKTTSLTLTIEPLRPIVRCKVPVISGNLPSKIPNPLVA